MYSSRASVLVKKTSATAFSRVCFVLACLVIGIQSAQAGTDRAELEKQMLELANSRRAMEAKEDLVGLMNSLGFKEIPISSRSAAWWSKANDPNNEYQVAETDGRLMISRIPTSGRSLPVEFKTGTLTYTGINNGEWGGELYVTSTNGIKHQTTLLKANIVALQAVKDDLYILEGYLMVD